MLNLNLQFFGGRGGASGSLSIQNGFNGQWHGMTIHLPTGEHTIYFGPNGAMKNELGGIQQKVPDGVSSYGTYKRNVEKGYKVDVITPAQYKEMAAKRQKGIDEKPDYELGAGLPWGNRVHRKAARRAKINGAAAKRARRR